MRKDLKYDRYFHFVGGGGVVFRFGGLTQVSKLAGHQLPSPVDWTTEYISLDWLITTYRLVLIREILPTHSFMFLSILLIAVEDPLRSEMV